MADIQKKVNAEIECIKKILFELKKVKDKPNKENVILAGIGSYLQDIYTGIENILNSCSNIQMLLFHNQKAGIKN